MSNTDTVKVSSPRQVTPKLLSWASEVDDNALEQAARTSRMPFVVGHVALMPDAHLGFGATVGSVIPTSGAIMPSAVGVDIGCGMIATETDLTANDLPDSLHSLMPLIEQRIPAGVGQGHTHPMDDSVLNALGEPATELTTKQTQTTAEQFGTLGAGNHFVEVCLDERDRVWTVLHSGSRGIGNQLASKHIAGAKKLAKAWFIPLEDPDLAYFVENTVEFDMYIRDMLWAQSYAAASRQRMTEQATRSLFEVVGQGNVLRTINCHHNFTQKERHHGRSLWVTRKGAIKAAVGDEGVIPGSMGTRSYIVQGKGSRPSYDSCSHGAGRRMSRRQASKTFTVESLTEAMGEQTWNSERAGNLLDEHPQAYKDIDTVMADQTDLVEIEHTLRQVFNYKGT